MQSPISNTNLGLTRTSFKPGETITVTGNPGPNDQFLVLYIADANGKLVLDRYPDREEGERRR
jgi:hypothetical protein